MMSLFLYRFPFTLLFLFRCRFRFRFRFRFLFPFPFLFRIPVSGFSRRPKGVHWAEIEIRSFANPRDTKVVYHLQAVSRKSGWGVNVTGNMNSKVNSQLELLD